MSGHDDESAKRMAPPCAISALLAALAEESTAAARRHRDAGRSAHWYHFLAFPLYVFRGCLTQRPWRPAPLWFALGILRACGTLFTWGKVWEAEHCPGPDDRRASAP